jgi:hypothetical protein
MLLEIKQVRTEYTRLSKNGTEHTYFRNRSTAVLKCDSCAITFERTLKQMDHRRLSPEYTHVCPNCNPKQYAQSKGVERRRFWNTTVDLDIDIDKI